MAEENIAANKNLALKASEQKFSQANTQLLTAASTRKTEADIENIKNTMAIQAQQMKLDNRDKAIALIKELGTANAD
jgi:secreted Zn-dependent insulinase-like peptidase